MTFFHQIFSFTFKFWVSIVKFFVKWIFNVLEKIHLIFFRIFLFDSLFFFLRGPMLLHVCNIISMPLKFLKFYLFIKFNSKANKLYGVLTSRRIFYIDRNGSRPSFEQILIWRNSIWSKSFYILDEGDINYNFP